MLGSEKEKNDDDEEWFTDDIEVVKTGKHSDQINKEHIHRITEEKDQIFDDIDRHESYK